MEDIIVRQGDQYSIAFPILLDRHIVTADLINGASPELDGDVEIVVGKLRKTYRKNEVKFNELTYNFEFPLTQKETLALRAGMILKSQVRVKLKRFSKEENNTIYSYNGPDIRIIESLSREQL